MARVKRIVPLVLIAFLSGCMTTDTADIPDSPQACIATAPDGTPLSCTDWPLSGPAAANHPDVRTGWACTIDHDDEAPVEFFSLYAHADGRLGWAWRSPMPEGGIQFVTMALIEPGRTQWMLLPYQAEGFMAFPEAVAGMDGVAILRVLRVLLHEQIADAWVPIEGAQLAIGIVNGTGYYAWQIPGLSEPLVLDLMTEIDEGLPTPVASIVEVEGRRISAAVSNRGSSFAGEYFSVSRAALGDCWRESLPEDAQ